MMRCATRLGLAAITILIFMAALLAADYPLRPVRLIVPFPPGGPSDTYARQITPYLSEALGQPVVVENIPGGNSIAGTSLAAKAAPDGYTFLMVTNTQTNIESLIFSRSYELLRDFIPVAGINRADLVLVVPPSLGARTLRDLIDLARAKPKGLSYGSSGPGSPYHMAGELLKSSTGIDVVHVPYRSAANAREDLIAGRIHMMFDTIPA